MGSGGFPWLTLRERPDMRAYVRSFRDPSRPDVSRVAVTTPAGARLDISGELQMRVDQRDERCVTVNVDPDTDQRDPAILRAIVRERQARAGVYGSTIQPGRVAVGDRVVIARGAGVGGALTGPRSSVHPL